MKKHFYPEPSEGLPSFPAGVHTRIGTHAGEGRRIGIAAARFNIKLVGPMVESAVETLISHGVRTEDIEVAWVPGSYELPLMLKRMFRDPHPDALVPCGLVLEGSTRHAQLIMSSLTQAFTQLSLDLDCPVIDAVVHAHTLEQAKERCLGGAESRGAYAALAALECAGLG